MFSVTHHFISMIIPAFLGDYEDAIAIMAIVVLNAALGFTQEASMSFTLTTPALNAVK